MSLVCLLQVAFVSPQSYAFGFRLEKGVVWGDGHMTHSAWGLWGGEACVLILVFGNRPRMAILCPLTAEVLGRQ